MKTNKKVVLFGEANFSFSVAYAEQLLESEDEEELVCTTPEKEVTVFRLDPEAALRVEKLQAWGHKVFFETRYEDWDGDWSEYDLAIFNFPFCTQGKFGKPDLAATRRVIVDFLILCSQKMHVGAEVRIGLATHKELTTTAAEKFSLRERRTDLQESKISEWQPEPSYNSYQYGNSSAERLVLYAVECAIRCGQESRRTCGLDVPVRQALVLKSKGAGWCRLIGESTLFCGSRPMSTPALELGASHGSSKRWMRPSRHMVCSCGIIGTRSSLPSVATNM